MGWQASTVFANFAVGTTLCVFERTQIAGAPERKLAAPSKLNIELPSGWLAGDVTYADEDRAVIQLPDGTVWEISPAEAHEQGSHIEMPGMWKRDWVVRRQIP